MKIVFYLGYADPAHGYGSELAFRQLAQAFFELGHVIYLIEMLPTSSPIPGVISISPDRYRESTFDLLIISRYINFYLYFPLRAPKVYLWLHDVGLQPAYEGKMIFQNGRYLLENVILDGCVAQTQWHASTFLSYHPQANVSVIGNGLGKGLVLDPTIPRVPFKFIYTSSPTRGLSYLLDIFPQIQKRWPQASLWIYRGPEEFTPEQRDKINQHEFIHYPGALPNQNLFREFQTASVWLYPTHFAETFCISALEAQAAGCTCICTSVAALTEIVGDRGYLLKSSSGTPECTQEILTVLEKVFAGETRNSQAWALQQTWANRAQRWIEMVEGCTPTLNSKVESPTISIQTNWSLTLPAEFTRMIPPNFPYRVVCDGSGIPFVIGGLTSRPPKEKENYLLMEPDCNRGHLPWQHVKPIIPRNMIEWHLAQSWNELEQPLPQKTKEISMILSAEQRLPGHRYRHQLAEYLDQHLTIDLYGRHQRNFRNNKGPLVSKDPGILPYRYHVVVENCCQPNYFTEKLADSLLGGCLTFYWGCPNITDYVDPRALIFLSGDPSRDLGLIQEAISRNEYEQRKPFLEIERKRMLQWTLFPTLERYLKDGPECQVPTRVVNLSRRVDRWEKVTRELTGLCYTRFAAVDGKNLLIRTKEIDHIFTTRVPYQKNPYPGHRWVAGVLGCALSHYALWQEAARSSTYLRIFEDDIVLQPSFSRKYRLVHQWMMENNWDVVFLGYLDDRPLYQDEKVIEFEDVHLHRFNPVPARAHGGGTHAYCISPSGARKLLDLVEKHGMSQPVDWFMIEMFSFLRCFKTLPHLVEPNFSGDTDIQRDTTQVK